MRQILLWSIPMLVLELSSLAQAFTSPALVHHHHSAMRLSMVASGMAPSMKTGAGSKKNKGGGITGSVNKLNLFRKLPWNERREQEARSRQIRREAAQLYRELGIAEDATFEDINDATEALKRKYRDNLKKQIKVDVVKDKIMQLRLEQRMGGMVSQTKEARADSYLNKNAAEYRNKSNKWQPPKWTRGLVQAPKKEWRDTCFTMFGFMTAVGFLLTGAAKMMCFLSMIVGVGLMQSRGTSSEYSLGARGKGFRMFGGANVMGIHTAQALFFGLTLFFFTYFGAQFVTYSSSLRGNAIEFPLVNLACQAVMMVSAMYMHFYKGTATKTDYDDE